MKSPSTLFFAALTALAVASPLRADPADWSFSWSPTNGTLYTANQSAGSITLSSEPTLHAFGDTNVIATNITVKSTVNPSTPVSLAANEGMYQLTLTIKDTASNKTGALSFTGQLQGSFSSRSANITNSFFAPTTQSLSLGGDTFTVTMGSFVPPGPPGSSAGAIGAFVSVKTAGGNPNPSSTSPEPSSLLLCGLGAAGFAAAGWRRRRSAARMAR